MAGPLKLRAEDAEDLGVVSACLQDAIVPIGEMCFLPDERRFVLVVNRFRWEACGPPGLTPLDSADTVEDCTVFERTHCAIRIEGVEAARCRGLDLRDRGQILELLAIAAEASGVVLHFAGGACIRLEASIWRCVVEDIGEPWPTTHKPRHRIEE